MSRRDDERLQDILDCTDAINNHLTRGGLHEGLVFDAVVRRLGIIGEAVKAIQPSLLAMEPEVDWRNIARMRDFLAHRYFDTAFGIVEHCVIHEIPQLAEATTRLHLMITTRNRG